jgi:hypothetical protein
VSTCLECGYIQNGVKHTYGYTLGGITFYHNEEETQEPDGYFGLFFGVTDFFNSTHVFLGWHNHKLYIDHRWVLTPFGQPAGMEFDGDVVELDEANYNLFRFTADTYYAQLRYHSTFGIVGTYTYDFHTVTNSDGEMEYKQMICQVFGNGGVAYIFNLYRALDWGVVRRNNFRCTNMVLGNCFADANVVVQYWLENYARAYMCSAGDGGLGDGVYYHEDNDFTGVVFPEFSLLHYLGGGRAIGGSASQDVSEPEQLIFDRITPVSVRSLKLY